MKLHEYLASPGAMKQIELAKAIDVQHGVLIHQWATELRRVPAEHCPKIERATNGLVRCEDMRPDVDWAYLRNTDCRENAA